ncbi:hypothetical protein ACM55F_00280 [Flavobacterium sp. XS2P12]|uniref:hypothetical protein n=1 Tax=Flavobacterium melibiosi TaxID=3398734 RepID=UPI003A84EB53
MELAQNRGKKKKDKKPLYILAGFLMFFGVFIYLITRPSDQSKALKELETSFNKKDVEMVWYKYKADLYQDEEFLFETRKKLSGLNLSEEEIKECRGWLPIAPTSINLIIIPDLSRRIIDTLNNPNQISNDIFVLETVWKAFVDFSKLKQDSKDKLIIDVTDIDQAKGQFGEVANNLQFDLSNHKGKSNRLFFTANKDKQFETSITEMYNLAKEKPLGADYRFYLRRYLINHLKKPTLFDNYINKVIIITDGYLEAEGRPADTKIYGFERPLHQAVSIGNTLEVITSKGLNIPKVDIDLSNSEILVCEVNERKAGKGFDFEILKAYWEDWFKRMNVKKVNFIQREQANQLTAKRVTEFITK